MVPRWPVSGLRQDTGAPGSPNCSARKLAAPAALLSRGSRLAVTGTGPAGWLPLGGTDPVKAFAPVPAGPEERPASPAQAASARLPSAAATMRNAAMSPAIPIHPRHLSGKNRAKLGLGRTRDDGGRRDRCRIGGGLQFSVVRRLSFAYAAGSTSSARSPPMGAVPSASPPP